MIEAQPGVSDQPGSQLDLVLDVRRLLNRAAARIEGEVARLLILMKVVDELDASCHGLTMSQRASEVRASRPAVSEHAVVADADRTVFSRERIRAVVGELFE